VFTDPARFDITRANARDHLAFASGVHACLGAALARIEGVTALRALFETFPDLRLTAPPTAWTGQLARIHAAASATGQQASNGSRNTRIRKGFRVR
jgi:cytochrome P450